MAFNRWSNRSIRAQWSIDNCDDDEEEKVKFLMSSPEPFSSRLDNHMKEETRKATSRTKLIDLLGAEYLVLLNEQDDDDLKHHKNILQAARKIKVVPKPNGKSKRLERKFSIDEEPEDDTFNEEENQSNFRKYHHIGTDNWGEDSWNDIGKRKDHKRRSSAPIITIPKR